jgi:predicted RNase H-like HicB family nuclease
MKPAKSRIANRTVAAVFESDGEWFIARCIDYPVTTQGRTFNAAKKNLQEAVELYVETWGDSHKEGAREVYLTNIAINS